MSEKVKIEELLTRGVEEVIDRKHLEEKLLSGKKLRIKLGNDPTSKNIHIGRAIELWKLKDFQDLGHKIIFIVGDFTGLIGDTSDKEAERPMLTKEQVQENMKDYVKQVGKILDLSKIETVFNSDWLKKLDYLEIAEQADQFSLHEFEARENIAKRMREGKRVSLRELLYPLMQGYDSVELKADLEIGGTDQRFNLLAGRTLQKFYGQEPQDIMTLPLLEGTDGRKMSSSWGNVINITDVPNDMFGKAMSIPDSLIIKYLTFCTRIPMSEIKEIEKEIKTGQLNPRDAKIRLAKELVTIYHSKEEAEKAEEEFNRVFAKKEKPTEMPEVKAEGNKLIDVLVEAGLVDSKSEARRLAAQKAIKKDDQVIQDIEVNAAKGIYQLGKRRFLKIK